jgi:uncharacterized protein YndB with AHSA1/START domain
MSNPAESTRTLVIERVFPHPPEKLWRALTDNPLIAQWLMKNDFEPVVGRKFQFRSQPMPNWDGVIDCEVLIVDHLKRLSYSWIHRPSPRKQCCVRRTPSSRVHLPRCFFRISSDRSLASFAATAL